MSVINKKCEWCDKSFDAPIKEINRGNGKFCSLKCSVHSQNENRPKGKGRTKLTRSQKIDKYGLEFVICERLQKVKIRAKRKGLDFSLETKDILDIWEKQNGKCYYTKEPMTWGAKEVNYNTHMSIDRVDSTKGYTKDNVVLCSARINTIKNNISIEELNSICENLNKFYNKRE